MAKNIEKKVDIVIDGNVKNAVDSISILQKHLKESKKNLEDTRQAIQKLSADGGKVKVLEKAFLGYAREVENAEKRIKNLQKTTQQTTKGLGGLGASIKEGFAGVAGINLGQLAGFGAVAIGIQQAFQFLGDSIKEAREASKIWKQVRVDVENAGLTFSDVKGRIEEVSKSFLQFGLDDDEVAANIGRLTLSFGNLKNAVAVNSIAVDLAAKKNIDLETASKLLILAAGGQGRGLKDLGIVVDDTRSAFQILTDVQTKVSGSLIANSDSIDEGLQNWKELKEIVGGGVLTAFNKVYIAFEKIRNISRQFGGKLFDYINPSKDQGDITKLFTDYAPLPPKAPPIKEELDPNIKSSGASIDNAARDRAIEAAKTAKERLIKIQTDLRDKLKDINKNVKENLIDLAEDYQNKVRDIAKQITALTNDIAQAQKDLNKKNKDGIDDFADKYIDAETKQKELADKIREASTKAESDKLVEEFNKNKESLEGLKSFVETNQGAITEAKRKAGLSEVELAFENYNKQREIDQQAYNEKLQDTQRRILDLQSEAEQEKLIYIAKVQEQSRIYQEANDRFKAFSQERKFTIQNEVEAEIKLFNELASSIQKANSARSISAIKNIAGARADGGGVNGGSSYLVGERGPEIFTPSGGGVITPNEKLGGGNNINVSISINGANDSKDVAKQIIDKLKLIGNVGIAGNSWNNRK